MVEAILSYVIKAIDESSSVMDRIKSSVGLLGSSLSGLGGGFAQVGNVMTGFAAGGVAGAAITALGEVAQGLQSCIKEASASEAVFTSLGAAVTRSGTAWDTVSEATKNALLAMQKTTVYSDEQLAAALERLMTFGLSYADSMNALGKAVDFASAKHMDLTSAATLVGKAMDGNTGILKRYGVDVASSKDQIVALKDAHDAAATAIKAMGAGVDAWVTSVTAAIGADSTFESGLGKAKDKAQYLIDQFQQGNIDLPQFTQAMTSLGVPLNEAAMKGGTAAEVLAKLNEQFGGAAQANASTYAGLQERLKNATQEVGEKIGTIFLPALASLTEGMLPLVDNLGKAVDATTAWLTEVAKMPEVKGAITFVQEAFAGLTGYLQDLWGFIVEQFSPALTELMGAFKDLWDALSPIGAALQELLSAFGDTSGMDIFKGMLTVLVINIRAIAEVIKEVAPYIKAFVQGFKDAADFITPILTQIGTAIRTFIDELKMVFQGFYDWLVGGSLWTDMWNQMLTIASQLIGQLISDLGSKLFDPMKNAFTGAMQGVQDLWGKGWQNLKAAGEVIWPLISGGMKAWEDIFKGDLQGALDQVKQNWETSWQAVQITFDTISDSIKGGWTAWFAQMQSAFDTVTRTIQTTWDTAWATMHTTFTTISGQIGTALVGKLEEMKTAVSTSTSQYAPIATQALTAMQSSVNVGMQLIQGDWQGALTSIQNALTQWGGVATGIMTGIMGALEGAVSAGVSAIQGMFSSLVASAQGTISTLQGMFSQAQSLVSSISQQVAQAATDLGQGIAAATAPATDAFTGLIDQAQESVKPLIQTVDAMAAGGVGDVVGTVRTISDEFGDMWQGVYDGANWLWTQLVGTSIWTDLMETMQSQAYSALGNIAGAFQDMSLAIPATIPYMPATASTSAPAASTSSAGAAGPLSLTIPITVTLDGQVISKTVEKRIVSNIDYRGKR